MKDHTVMKIKAALFLVACLVALILFTSGFGWFAVAAGMAFEPNAYLLGSALVICFLFALAF